MLECLLLGLAAVSPATQEQSVGIDDLRVGHWVRVKGTTADDGTFVVDELLIREPGDENEIIGTVRSTRPDDEDYAVIDVDGQPVFVGPKCDLIGVDVGSLLDLEGQRVEVEGYWRSPWKYSARELEVRQKGRDRLEGRIDSLRKGARELEMLGRRVKLPEGAVLTTEEALDGLELAERIDYDDPVEASRRIDDDDDLGAYRLAPNLWFATRLEWRMTDQRDHDLDAAEDEDRIDHDFNVRSELRWAPTDRIFGLVEYRHAWRDRREADDGDSDSDRGRLNEAHFYLSDVIARGVDLQIGRQDFDEDREWLWDENLDAVRMFVSRARMNVELFAAGVLAGGDIEDEETYSYGVLASSRTTSDWSVGGYLLHRTTDLRGGRDATHVGLRALGEFVDEFDSWGEASFLTGEDDGVRLSGLGLDFGTTWAPDALDPWYFTAGYAYGSGDGDLSDGEDASFRQTGLHDNNAKFGGVTSFRYYGELFEPELSNLRIATLGVGRRFNKRDSLDLVVHKYDQDVALASLVDTQIDATPTGVSRDIGWEVDLIYGNRSDENYNIELVLGRFDPGAAFIEQKPAWLIKLQLRFVL